MEPVKKPISKSKKKEDLFSSNTVSTWLKESSGGHWPTEPGRSAARKRHRRSSPTPAPVPGHDLGSNDPGSITPYQHKKML